MYELDLKLTLSKDDVINFYSNLIVRLYAITDLDVEISHIISQQIAQIEMYFLRNDKAFYNKMLGAKADLKKNIQEKGMLNKKIDA